MDEFIEIQSSTGTWYQRWLVRITTTLKQVKRRKSIPQGLLSFRLQCLVALCLETLTLTQKNLLVFAKGCLQIIWLHLLCRCVHLHTATLASHVLKCPCEHHGRPAVQSFQGKPQPQALDSPEQININFLSLKPKWICHPQWIQKNVCSSFLLKLSF